MPKGIVFVAAVVSIAGAAGCAESHASEGEQQQADAGACCCATSVPTSVECSLAAPVECSLAMPVAVDADGRALTTISADQQGEHGEALCSASAPTRIGGMAERRAIMIQNRGPRSIFVCPDDSCTADDGIEVRSGENFSFDVREPITLYCVAEGADQVVRSGTRFLEVR